MRLAAANGFGSVGQLFACVKGVDTDLFNAICARGRLSETETAWLGGPIPRRWGVRELPLGLVTEDFNQTLRRWCPLCLAEHPYVRLDWTLKLSTTCGIHGVVLRGRCRRCGSTQRWGTGSLLRCACSASLLSANLPPGDRTMIDLSHVLSGRVAGGYFIAGPLSPAECHRVVRYLGQFANGIPSRPGQIARLDDLDVALPLVEGAARLLGEWPMGFQRMLATMHQHAVQTPSIRKAFWPLYRVLYEDLAGDAFQFLRDVFEAYLREHWWGVVCRRNRLLSPATLQSHPRMPLRQVAKASSVPLSTLGRLLQAELIPSEQVQLPSGRRQTSLHRADVERVAALAEGGMNAKQVARRLCLTKDRIRQLIDAGLLQPLVSTIADRASAWMIPAAQVEEWIFMGLAVPQGAVRTVQLCQAMQHWQVRAAEFVALAEAIRGRKFPAMAAATTPTSLGEICLERGSFQEWLQNRRALEAEGLSVAAAGKELGVKEQVAFELAQLGLLDCTTGAKGFRRVSRQALAVFRTRYVSLADVARSQGRSPRYLLPQMRSRPVCGPSIDGARQYFFLRADVEAEGVMPAGGVNGRLSAGTSSHNAGS